MIESIFLTGATGVLGGRLLLEILLKTKANVYCLIRAESPDLAQKRVQSILAVYDTDHKLPADWRNRVFIITGDITEEYLGTNAATYRELSEIVDIVIHCAGYVRYLASYSKLKAVNVDGLSNIIDFCLQKNIPLMHTSTFSVLANKVFHEVKFHETDLDIGQTFIGMNYEKSKFEGEKLVHKAGSEKGLNWIIIRPGDILGDSVTGAYPLTNTKVSGIYYSAVKTIIDTALAPVRDDNFIITPVDFVAASMVYLLSVHDQKLYGKTFHLVNPDQKKFNDLAELIKGYGYKIRSISTEDYINIFKYNTLMIDGKPYHSPFTSIMTYFQNDLNYVEQAEFDCTNALAYLRTANIQCPKIDHNLIETYLAYCIEKEFILPPEKQRIPEINDMQ